MKPCVNVAKYGPEKTRHLDTFHAVPAKLICKILHNIGAAERFGEDHFIKSARAMKWKTFDFNSEPSK